MGGLHENPKEALNMSSKRKPVSILKVNSRVAEKGKPIGVILRPRSTNNANKVTIIV